MPVHGQVQVLVEARVDTHRVGFTGCMSVASVVSSRFHAEPCLLLCFPVRLLPLFTCIAKSLVT